MTRAEGLSEPALAALQRAALSIGRLDAALEGHPLLPAWLYMTRLEAARRHAAADGFRIGVARLAARIEGLRLRVNHDLPMAERGEEYRGLGHALHLYALMLAAAETRPDDDLDPESDRIENREAVAHALHELDCAAAGRVDLIRIGLGVHTGLVHGLTRGALRAAVPLALHNAGLTRPVMPLLAGAEVFRRHVPMDDRDAWLLAFLEGLAREAEDGRESLRTLEYAWRDARGRIGERRSHSRMPSAVDLMAGAGLIGPARLADLLDCSMRGAGKILDELVQLGAAVEVTGRATRRLYGLSEFAAIRDETLGPKRPMPGRSRGRPSAAGRTRYEEAATPPSAPRPESIPARLEPLDFDFAALDRLIADTDQAIRKAKSALARHNDAA